MFLRGLIALAATVFVTGSVSAQVIGDAQFIQRDVRGIAAGRLYPISTGDSVYRDQIVRTFAESSAVLSFLDKSLMSIGPQSEVRLDEFVFRGGTGPRTIEAVKGFFRFISGAGPGGHDYQVRTPHATIAVRGTTFDVRVAETGTTVVLHEGAVDVCAAGQCRSISPGQTVEASRTGVGGVRAFGAGDWTFGSDRGQRSAAAAARSAMDRLAAARPAHPGVTAAVAPAAAPVIVAQATSGTPAPQTVAALRGAPADPVAVASEVSHASASGEVAENARLASLPVVTLAPTDRGSLREPVRLPDALLSGQPPSVAAEGATASPADRSESPSASTAQPSDPPTRGVRSALRIAFGLANWSAGALISAVTISPVVAGEQARPADSPGLMLCVGRSGAGESSPGCSWPSVWRSGGSTRAPSLTALTDDARAP